jgi:hypothetical protein
LEIPPRPRKNLGEKISKMEQNVKEKGIKGKEKEKTESKKVN